MKLLTTITDNKIEYRIVHQVVHLGKAINKMTVKKKEWEWVWEIDLPLGLYYLPKAY